MNSFSAHKQTGFSIVEIILAIFLTGALVLVVANIPQAIRLITSSQAESKVREVAAKKIEDLRLIGYDNLANGVNNFSDPRLNSLASVSAVSTTENCPSSICLNGELAKQVTVSISWRENNTKKTFEVATIVAKGGIK